ncbi:MAG TPA: hypothetical protein VFQ34_11275 [Nitrospiraceae bacterium]|nr:hypothetical protein [Nitrospiraceae bacterium]
MKSSGFAYALLVSAALGLTGCEYAWLHDRPSSLLDNAHFLETWKTYLHCRASSRPEEIRADLFQLTRVAHSLFQERQAAASLPRAIRSLVSTPPSRLSVDPQAMTTACALHGSQVAQAAGRPEMSIELLTAAVTAQQGTASAFYAAETDARIDCPARSAPCGPARCPGRTGAAGGCPKDDQSE